MNHISNGSTRLNAGETLLTIGEETYVLRPTLRKHAIISRRFGGIAKARQAIQDEDFDAIVFLIRNGTDMSDRDAKNLDDRVWKNGLDIDLLLPLFKYVAILNNGGRPLDSEMEQVFRSGGMKDVTNDDDQDAIEDHSQGNG
jgi:hypothetical protein